MAENTPFKCNDDSIQEDTCEWIEALYNTIWKLLGQNGNMQTNWYNLFNCNFITTYECCNNSNHKSQNISSNNILRLTVRDDAGGLIESLIESLEDLFKETIMDKNCDDCGKETRLKKNRYNDTNSTSTSCRV